MKQNLKNHGHHLGHYLVLLILLTLGFFVLRLAVFDKQLTMLVVLIIGVLYAVWGIVHHVLAHDITAKIVIEYILISSLGVTVIFFLLRGGLL